MGTRLRPYTDEARAARFSPENPWSPSTLLRGPSAGFRTLRHFDSLESVSYYPSLPSSIAEPVPMTEVVPDYRCGAVPASHRIPIGRPRKHGRTDSKATICRRFLARQV